MWQQILLAHLLCDILDMEDSCFQPSSLSFASFACSFVWFRLGLTNRFPIANCCFFSVKTFLFQTLVSHNNHLQGVVRYIVKHNILFEVEKCWEILRKVRVMLKPTPPTIHVYIQIESCYSNAWQLVYERYFSLHLHTCELFLENQQDILTHVQLNYTILFFCSCMWNTIELLGFYVCNETSSFI